MIAVMTGKHQATLPTERAPECSINAGSQDEDGILYATSLPSRGELARRWAGVGREWLKPGDDPVADLIHERLAD